MLSFFCRLIITTVAVILSAKYIPGLVIDDPIDLVVFGLILGCINAFIRPMIMFLTLPINILTLGLFSLVVNAFTYWLASELSYGVHVETVAGAFWGGFVIWIVSFFTNCFIKNDRMN